MPRGTVAPRVVKPPSTKTPIGVEKMASCAVCGVYFDLYKAAWCAGHISREAQRKERIIQDTQPEFCKVCPLGHPLHQRRGWANLPVREPTEEERELGFRWILT